MKINKIIFNDSKAQINLLNALAYKKEKQAYKILCKYFIDFYKQINIEIFLYYLWQYFKHLDYYIIGDKRPCIMNYKLDYEYDNLMYEIGNRTIYN